jgi:hypothetical protein
MDEYKDPKNMTINDESSIDKQGKNNSFLYRTMVIKES